MNTIETFHPRSPAEEASLHLASITSYIERLARELSEDHQEVLEEVQREREKEAKQDAITKYSAATPEHVREVLKDKQPVAPQLAKLNKRDILAFAGDNSITASLITVPGQLARTTHPIARVAQAIMSCVGLHFTAAGHTTQLVDAQQQPNLQAVSHGYYYYCQLSLVLILILTNT